MQSDSHLGHGIKRRAKQVIAQHRAAHHAADQRAEVKPDAHHNRRAVGRRERRAQLLHLDGQAREGARVLLLRAALAGDAARGGDVGVPGEARVIAGARAADAVRTRKTNAWNQMKSQPLDLARPGKHKVEKERAYTHPTVSILFTLNRATSSSKRVKRSCRKLHGKGEWAKSSTIHQMTQENRSIKRWHARGMRGPRQTFILHVWREG